MGIKIGQMAKHLLTDFTSVLQLVVFFAVKKKFLTIVRSTKVGATLVTLPKAKKGFLEVLAIGLRQECLFVKGLGGGWVSYATTRMYWYLALKQSLEKRISSLFVGQESRDSGGFRDKGGHGARFAVKTLKIMPSPSLNPLVPNKPSLSLGPGMLKFFS